MRLSSQNIRLRSLRHYDTNTWIYNFISVPQITQFLLKGAIISSKINPCSSSTNQKICKGWNNKTMTAIFSFISTLYLKQQTNILRCFCSLKFENSLFINTLFRYLFCSKRTIYTVENDQIKTSLLKSHFSMYKLLVHFAATAINYVSLILWSLSKGFSSFRRL